MSILLTMIPVILEGQMIFILNHGQYLKSLTGNFVEMNRNKSFALCCGAGGAQMFKEAEKGNKEVFIERTEDALENRCHSNCNCMSVLHDNDDRWTEI